MASRTYSERVIVLRKTRLREADLVVTMLAEDGRQVRAVAKGALKPSGSFASRLELYAESDVLLVEGRSLDIVKEARLVNAHEKLRFEYARSICAAPMVELLAIATQDELPVAHLFAMTRVALDALERASEERVPLVMTAFLLKASSVLGFRPSLDTCAECGRERGSREYPAWVSHAAGGVLCPDCASRQEAVVLPAATIGWVNWLIYSTFEQITNEENLPPSPRDLMGFAQAWIREHIGELRSLAFVMAEFAGGAR